MRIWIPLVVVAMSLACGKKSEPDTPPPADEPPAPPAAAAPADASPPPYSEHARLAATARDGDAPRDCYDLFVAINRTDPSVQKAAIPAVGAEPLALLLLDYAVVSGGDQPQGQTDPPVEQVTKMIEAYVVPNVPDDQREDYAEAARQAKSMTWPTETVASEVESGALAKTNDCTGAPPRAACQVVVDEPAFAWAIQRVYFTDATDEGKAWCQRHGGDWAEGAPAAGRIEQHGKRLRDLVGG